MFQSKLYQIKMKNNTKNSKIQAPCLEEILLLKKPKNQKQKILVQVDSNSENVLKKLRMLLKIFLKKTRKLNRKLRRHKVILTDFQTYQDKNKMTKNKKINHKLLKEDSLVSENLQTQNLSNNNNQKILKVANGKLLKVKKRKRKVDSTLEESD